jgi:hypothetical protein
VLLLKIATPSNVYRCVPGCCIGPSEMTGERRIKGFLRGYMHSASGGHSRFLKPRRKRTEPEMGLNPAMRCRGPVLNRGRVERLCLLGFISLIMMACQ